ncbi:MAG TPA: hypothetical protein VKP30_24465 [Polyangiaceae bacterium]|nr:hypothetical protein [Polyangiaceae bacterium]
MSSTRQPESVAMSPDQFSESESLQKLKRGEMSLDAYLDERAEEALAHVKGRVPQETLENLRFVLRERLRHDPVLIEMVRCATGLVPNPINDSGDMLKHVHDRHGSLPKL